MRMTVKNLALTSAMLLLFACSAPEVEPGLETIPTVEEPTKEVLPTATQVPTNTPAPTATAISEPTATPIPTDEPVDLTEEDDALADMEEAFSDLLGIEIVPEGTFAMDTLGVSFELPEGWSGIQMMGLMGMATNAELDPEFGLDTPTTEDGVLVMFVPTGGAPFDEMNSYTSDELMAEMANSGNSFDLEETELIEDRVPVTINGYEGVRTSLQGTEAGEELFIEMTILEHEELGYMMMTMGSPDEFEVEKENIDALTSSLVLTAPDQAALEEASEEMIEDLTGMFGGDGPVTEGRIDIPAVGVSFEVPEGWTALSMMGFIGMATNSSLDVAMGADQAEDGVVVMFSPIEGSTIDEAWEETSEEMISSITGPGTGISEDDVEVLEEREPVTINGYTGARTSLRFEAEGQQAFLEITILEHEGSTYGMMYVGNAAEYEAEQENYEFLINSLILSEPDLDAMGLDGFGEDFGGGFDDEGLNSQAEEPDVFESLVINEPVAFEAGSGIGYEAEVEVGSTYLIYLQGDTDITLSLFPADEFPEFIDTQVDNYEMVMWTATEPTIKIAGNTYYDEGAKPLKLSIFRAASMETNEQTITVQDDEIYFVVGMSEDADTKLVVTSESGTQEIDSGYALGSPEVVLLDEPGDYDVSVVEWETNEPLGTLFIVQPADDSCCTLP